MFRKQFKIKSNTRLKTTEKKKFRSEVIKQLPGLDKDDVEAISVKTNISVLDLLLGTGESVLVYICPKYPTFIFHKGIYFPTVYTLWQHADLLHLFSTNSFVFEKIKGGADLMLPGVMRNESTVSNVMFSKGQAVGVNLNDNISAVAVGEALIDSADLENDLQKGKCVHIIHYYGDFLSEIAPNLKIPLISNSVNVPKVEEIVEDNTNLENTNENRVEIQEELGKALEEVQLNDAVENKVAMEDMIIHCFYMALLTSAKKVQLPLLTNLFYKNHMLEVYPTGSEIDVKKSKYKKVSNFLEEMAKLGVITIEGNAAGVHKIIRIEYDHPLLRQFARENPVESAPEVRGKQRAGPAISEKHSVSAAVLPLFSLYGYSKGDGVAQTDIRRVITSYVKSKQLQDDDKRFVRLDDMLLGMLRRTDRQVTWEQLMGLVVGVMGELYQVNLPSDKVVSGKGKLPPIEVQVCSRAGNKKVTLINSLPLYGVDLHQFAKECQHGVAASTTINNPPHLKTPQLQIQGNQVNFVGKLLTEKYNIPKRYIRGCNLK